MKWNIVADSSCDLKSLDAKDIVYDNVPFVIGIDNKEYVDDDALNVLEMVTAMENSKEATRSSCPSPASWMEKFRSEGNVFAITISKALSGSYNSAMSAVDMLKEEMLEKKIHVINSASAGPGLNLIVCKLKELIEKGLSFEEIKEKIEQIVKEENTIFALCSYQNLIKNGRMPKIVGFIAQKLGLWGVGVASDEGEIVVKDKARGLKKALDSIVNDMKSKGKKISEVYISHCFNPDGANALKELLIKEFGEIKIIITENKGLCSYYAERNGLIVAYL